MDGIEASHCLRPEFTLGVIQTLVRDRMSINLTGAKGTGKTRLLKDIQNCGLPGVQIIYVDLKAHAVSFEGLMREVHRRMGLSGGVPDRFSKLFENLAGGTFYLVFLDNYDALLNNTRMDKLYDKNFFDDLNFIKNSGHVSLVCTSVRRHGTLPVFIEGKSFGNSWLTLHPQSLPALDRRQLIAELERRLDEYGVLWTKSRPDEKQLLLDCIRENPLPLPRLAFFVDKINNQTYEESKIKFKKRLKKCKKEFDRQLRNHPGKKLHKMKTAAEGTVIAAGLKGAKKPAAGVLTRLLKKILGL